MKGSRYAILKLIESGNFLERINNLVKDENAEVTIYDNWMPKSIHYDKEAELKDFLRYNFSTQLSNEIHGWWLKNKHPLSKTPNWDLVSTCTIKGLRGILLIEAKAHVNELVNEEKGKPKTKESSVENHDQIDKAISQANMEISKTISGLSISIDNCYQLSNRVAHAWWLANAGIPVVLLYLGFLNCSDMDDGKNKLLKTDDDWQQCFRNHAKQVGVDTIINKWVDCGKSKFITICKSY